MQFAFRFQFQRSDAVLKQHRLQSHAMRLKPIFSGSADISSALGLEAGYPPEFRPRIGGQ
jgi:hypothetical protein